MYDESIKEVIKNAVEVDHTVYYYSCGSTTVLVSIPPDVMKSSEENGHGITQLLSIVKESELKKHESAKNT